MKALAVALAALALITSHPAFAQARTESPERQAAMLAAEKMADQSYKIGPEDVLEVSVWREDALKKDVLVLPDGMLSFPLAGDVRAAGRSVGEVRAEIGKRLEKFIPDPVVSVAVNRVASQRIYVIGKVNKPGDFPVGRYIDVLQALAMAGGFNPFAAVNDVKIFRRQEGRLVSIPFVYNQLERGRNLEQNIVLQAGDVIVVP